MPRWTRYSICARGDRSSIRTLDSRTEETLTLYLAVPEQESPALKNKAQLSALQGVDDKTAVPIVTFTAASKAGGHNEAMPGYIERRYVNVMVLVTTACLFTAQLSLHPSARSSNGATAAVRLRGWRRLLFSMW